MLPSDYHGRTSLHYAALEGYTKTISTLLTSDLKLLDRTDEDGVNHVFHAFLEGVVTSLSQSSYIESIESLQC